MVCVEGGKNRKDAIGLSFFIEDNFGQQFIAHSGYQNASKTHMYLSPETRAGYLIACNTHVAPSKEDPDIDTDRLDVGIKDYLFEHVFPEFHK